MAFACFYCCCRYYPEGGWGWVVLACATLGQAIAHGIQLGAFPFPIADLAERKFAVAKDGMQMGECAKNYTL